MGDNETLCAVVPRLRLKRSSPKAGLEPWTVRSAGQRLTHRAPWAPTSMEKFPRSLWLINENCPDL